MTSYISLLPYYPTGTVTCLSTSPISGHQSSKYDGVPELLYAAAGRSDVATSKVKTGAKKYFPLVFTIHHSYILVIWSSTAQDIQVLRPVLRRNRRPAPVFSHSGLQYWKLRGSSPTPTSSTIVGRSSYFRSSGPFDSSFDLLTLSGKFWHPRTTHYSS